MAGPDLASVARALAPSGLAVAGAFHPGPEDEAPDGIGTLLLVGADGDRMWQAFRASAEAGDGAPDPLDRWSRRVLGAAAGALGGRAIFPFDGPPWPPFLRWGARAEGNRPSPVGLPVSPLRGLWSSWRGALALPERIGLPAAVHADPCLGCAAPCLTACPVGALGSGPYDTAACAAHAGGPGGAACRDGCLVRTACPVGAPPPLGQRRFHMAAFLATRQIFP